MKNGEFLEFLDGIVRFYHLRITTTDLAKTVSWNITLLGTGAITKHEFETTLVRAVAKVPEGYGRTSDCLEDIFELITAWLTKPGEQDW